MHACDPLSHRLGVVRPFVEPVDGRLTDRLDSEEEIAAAAVVGQFQEIWLLREIDGQLRRPGAAERPDRLAQRLERTGGVIEIVVPEKEPLGEARAHPVDQAIAPKRTDNGKLDQDFEDAVVQAGDDLADRLPRAGRALAADLLHDVAHVAVPDVGTVGQKDGAEMAIELAAAREGRGGDDLLRSPSQPPPDPHVEGERAAIADPLEGGPVDRFHGAFFPDVVDQLGRGPLALSRDRRVHVTPARPLVGNRRGVRPAEHDRESLAGGRVGDSRLARPAVGLPGGVRVGGDEQDIVVAVAQVDFVTQDLLEGRRPLDLVVLHRDTRRAGQDAVLPQEADQVREADAGTADERSDGALQTPQQTPAADRFVNDVGVARGQADEVADRRHGCPPGGGSSGRDCTQTLLWDRPRCNGVPTLFCLFD